MPTFEPIAVPASVAEHDPAALEESADRRFQAGAVSDALALLEQALSLYEKRGSTGDQARCQQVVGYLCFVLRDHVGAEHAYRESIRIKHALGDLHGTATGWGRLAEVLQHAGDHHGALRAFDESLAFLRRCGALKDLGIVLNNMAVSHRELGQREQAIRCHARALEIRRDVGDHEGLAASLHNMGVLYADIGACDAAWTALEEARRLREELGDRSNLASTELRIGILHEQQGDYESALTCYERTIALSSDAPCDADNLAAALCNMGGLLVARGEPSRALSLLEQALGLLDGGLETPHRSYVEYNLGLAKIAQGRVEDGLAALAIAERIQQRCGDVRHLSATLSARAMVEVQRGDFAKAELLLQEALEIQHRLEEHYAKIHTLKLLGHCKTQQGQVSAARRYMAQAEQLAMLVEARTPAAASAPTGTPVPHAPHVFEDARRSLQ